MSSKDALFDDILDLEERTWRALQHRGSDLVPFLTRDCISEWSCARVDDRKVHV